jgi:hypothetical protein
MKNRKLQEKWEKKLQKLGLGVDQPMTDNSEGELAEVQPFTATNTRNPDHARLRTMMDGNDFFLKGGFEIKKIRSLERNTPSWALNNTKTQQIILTAFPKLTLNPPKGQKAKKAHQKRIEKAGRWVRIIYLYYRMELPRPIVAKELGMSESTLRSTLRNILRVSQGLTVSGETRKSKNATYPAPPEGREEENATEQDSHLRISRAGGDGQGRTKQNKEVQMQATH